MDQLLIEFGALVGVGALIAFLINLGKSVGFIKDGTAANWSIGFNLVGLCALFASKVIAPDLDVAGIDQELADFMAVLGPFVAYVVQFISARVVHDKFRGVFLVGKSYSQ